MLLGERSQSRTAVEPGVVELSSDRSQAERMVDKGIERVAVIVALDVERGADRYDLLLAEVRPRVEEAHFWIEHVVLHAAGITERPVRCGISQPLERADPVLEVVVQNIS